MTTEEKDITTFELAIEYSYDGFKKELLALQKQRKKFEKDLERYAQKVKDGVRPDRNRDKMKVLYGKIEEITILRYNIFEVAFEAFPEIANDKDMPRGERDSVEYFDEERKQSKEELDEANEEMMNDLLLNAR